jgi:hypothetical protein
MCCDINTNMQDPLLIRLLAASPYHPHAIPSVPAIYTRHQWCIQHNYNFNNDPPVIAEATNGTVYSALIVALVTP